MNRFLILVFNFSLFICCINSVSAQIEKGNYILGGSAGIENISSAFGNTFGYNVTTINIHPMYGSFLTDRFLLGANANLNYQLSRFRGAGNIKLGPLVRYYFNNIFLQVDYNFGIPSR